MNDITTNLLGQDVYYTLGHGGQALGKVRAVYVGVGGVHLLIETQHGRLEHISASSVKIA